MLVGCRAIERRTVPQRQALLQDPVTGGQVGGGRLFEQATKPVGVDGVGVDVEYVAAVRGHQADTVVDSTGPGEQRPDAGDISTQGLRRPRWRIAVPQQADQPRERDDMTGFQEQDAQQAAFLPARQRHDPPVVGVYLDRSEHSEPHARTVARCPMPWGDRRPDHGCPSAPGTATFNASAPTRPPRTPAGVTPIQGVQRQRLRCWLLITSVSRCVW